MYNKNIVDDIRKIPSDKRKYYPENKKWAVALDCIDELEKLALKHHLFIDLPDKKKYSNNSHFATFTRQIIGRDNEPTIYPNIPNGIKYCEGRKSKKLHTLTHKEFWWCCNQECFQNCITSYLNTEEHKNSELV